MKAKKAKPVVKYVLYIDDREEEKFDTLQEAKDAGCNYGCDVEEVFREVDGVLGKCLYRLRESDYNGGYHGPYYNECR